MEVGLAALVFSGVNFLKFLTNRQVKPAVTQAVAWLSGIGIVWMADASDGLPFIDFVPDQTNFWGKVLLGASIGGTASAIESVKRAIDRTDSAAMPSLIPERPPQS